MENFFAAANTAGGFVCWYDDIFNPRELDFCYIIKGGSGTGKSTLMKKVAAKAEKLGGRCERYYCSSDPTSLDGVIATLSDGRRIAMLDGTAPHTHDPKYPGAAEAIVNLGQYWCEDILKGQREEIITLSERKSRLFGQAYGYFGAAGTLLLSRLNEVRGAILSDKMRFACERLLTQRMRECHVKGSVGRVQIRGLSALSTHGEVRFDSFSDADKVCLVLDAFGTAPLLLDTMQDVALELELPFYRAPMPLLPHLTEALYFPTLSMSVVSNTERTDAKEINMARFVERERLCGEARVCRRLLKKSEGELIDAGLAKLAQVRDVHGELEKIYMGAMDFTRLGEATERLLEVIFA